MRESEVEAYLVRRVKELGGDTRKMKWIGRRGAPDRFVMLHGGFFVELKAPGGKLRVEQKREMDLMRRMGIRAYVATSAKDIEDVLLLAWMDWE